MSKMKNTIRESEARDYLLANYINPSTKLLIIIKHVSGSGMTRRMKVFIGDGKGKSSHITDITYYIADLCNLRVNDKGLKIQGCGMDMTFWLADYITSKLWPTNKPKELKGNGGGSCRCLDWSCG